MNFKFLNFSQIHVRVRTFGFRNKIDVSHFVFIEDYGPVWAVIGYWC